MEKEIWDAYDKCFNKIEGKILVRGEAIPDGLYHLVADILVKHIDGTYLITKRALTKEVWPGYYEASAGGSALLGETPLKAATRELFEETGIKTSDLKQLEIEVSNIKHTIYFVYLAVVDIPKDSIVLNKEETIDYTWIEANEKINYNLVKTRTYKYIKI